MRSFCAPRVVSRVLGYAVVTSAISVIRASGASTVQVPPLPDPVGTVINVASEAELQLAALTATSRTTIVIAPGTYNLSSTLYLVGLEDVTLRGATNNRDDVVLVGTGMTNSLTAVPFGVWTNGRHITIANLTIRDVYNHPIIINPGAQSPRVYNVHLIDAGEQFIKSNPDDAGGGVDNGVVEYSVFEYTTTARDDYTNGVDVHTGKNWIVRHNLFVNISAPAGQLAGPAVLIWNKSSGAVVEGNTFINCQREISMGLQERVPYDHAGGIVRNNFIYRDAGRYSDVGIYLGDSPSTQVLHNTVLLMGNYPNAVEYRFVGTTDVVIANNLLDGAIAARDGATGTVAINYDQATPSMFVNAAVGDLHLRANASDVIDRVSVLPNARTDWDGQLRPIGSAADYGADEFDPFSSSLAASNVMNSRICPRDPPSRRNQTGR